MSSPENAPRPAGRRDLPGVRQILYDRRSYVILVLLCLLAAAGGLAWDGHLARQARQQDTQTRQELCTLLVPASTPLISRPADPQAKPALWQQWKWQQRYITVKKEFECR